MLTTPTIGPLRIPGICLLCPGKVGHRVRTELSEDTLADTYAVVNFEDRIVRIPAGCRPNTRL
jgi:hypothetical protein